MAESAVSALQALGSFVAEGVCNQVPEATRAQTSLHVTDTVGAWVAGAHTSEGRRLLANARAIADDHLGRAIAVHCALARLSEVDNIHLASSITPGGIVIPAALTIAASRSEITSDALVEAIVAGIEAMVRLGIAIDGPTILYRGIWPTYFATAFGVAAVAARLYNFNAIQAAHALGLALSFAAPGVGSHNAQSTSRWFALGHAAYSGFAAAQAAQAGFTSDLNLLNGDFLSRVYGITPNINAFIAGIGRHWAIGDTSIKPWCAARQTIAATQGLLEMIELGLSRQEIVAVEVHVPPPFLRMIDHGVEAGNRTSYLTSVQYRVALAAYERSRLYDVNSSPTQLADDIKSFMQKISVKADQELLTHYPTAWPARLVVQTVSGTRDRSVIVVPGDPTQPFDERQIEEKFRRVLVSVAAEHVDSLLLHCRSAFDQPRSVMALIDKITGAN